MKTFNISEQEREDIFKKYFPEPDNDILIFLRRNFEIGQNPLGFGKYIVIFDKLYFLNAGKKGIKKRLFYIVKEKFPDHEDSVINKTIKDFLDMFV